MNILKEISSEATMKEMIINLLHNIRFYLKNREELVDIHYSNDYLYNYTIKLKNALEIYSNNKVPSWFKETNPCYFLDSDFPYAKSKLPWLFSFEDYIDVLLKGKGKIEDREEFIYNNTIYSFEEYQAIKHTI